MSVETELVREVKNFRTDIDTINKKLKDMASSHEAGVDQLRGVLMGNGNAVLGFGDRGQAHVQARGGTRCKSLRDLPENRGREKDFGEILTEIWNHGYHHDNSAVERINKRGGRQRKAMEGVSGAAGGFLIPTIYSNQFLSLAAEKSFLRDKCTVIPMTTMETILPAYDQTIVPSTGTSAVFAGVTMTWNPQGISLSNTQPQLRQKRLVARDLTMYTVVNNQLMQDNAYGLEQLLVTLFRDAIAWAYDYYLLRGTGVDEPLGVLNSSAAYSQARSSASTFKPIDAAKMYGRLLSDPETPLWAVHRSLVEQLIRFGTDVNTNIIGSWMPAGGGKSSYADNPPTTLLGYPLFVTEKLPNLNTAGDGVLLDASKILLGDRMEIQIESSKDVLFGSNQTAWRVICRWDAMPWLDNVYTTADGTFTQGMAVLLAA